MKGIIRGALQGIGMALFLFCVTCSIFDITEGGRFVRENYQMTKMVIGSVICGIAWGAPSVIYNKDSLPRAIHPHLKAAEPAAHNGAQDRRKQGCRERLSPRLL